MSGTEELKAAILQAVQSFGFARYEAGEDCVGRDSASDLALQRVSAEIDKAFAAMSAAPQLLEALREAVRLCPPCPARTEWQAVIADATST